MSIDLQIVELTAGVLEILSIIYTIHFTVGSALHVRIVAQKPGFWLKTKLSQHKQLCAATTTANQQCGNSISCCCLPVQGRLSVEGR